MVGGLLPGTLLASLLSAPSAFAGGGNGLGGDIGLPAGGEFSGADFSASDLAGGSWDFGSDGGGDFGDGDW
ncbi:hypothetical protein [Streptomyces roseochromogenus]|uniref:Uncharacterized protein n=1 Tax=Streptomyces roseochromogenus subsp. oscitans DS 12.976 TaxID=1352936 RepID=V6KS80_STRRC|nr:hypothetical protein [Streptomyces roseochromogenus]EST35050.1 hypothetical protein M878_07420 [Streptomyces roseochromogenus subsp. oscitans DS 12.976]